MPSKFKVDPQTGRYLPKYAPIEIGERFGMWTVLEKGSFKHNQQRWKVRCDCGQEKEVAQQHLRGGKSTKCLKCLGKSNTRRWMEKGFGIYGSSRRSVVTQAAIDILYDVQKGVCPICNKPFESKQQAAWDHDHNTGAGRDLLHRGCNVFLGFIERDPSILDRVKAYCERYKIPLEKIDAAAG